jgi:hypothetical protein
MVCLGHQSVHSKLAQHWHFPYRKMHSDHFKLRAPLSVTRSSLSLDSSTISATASNSKYRDWLPITDLGSSSYFYSANCNLI